MRDVNRLYNFYNQLTSIHVSKFPDWRFGQLIMNFFGWLASNKGISDPFFLEEDEMLDYLSEYAEKF